METILREIANAYTWEGYANCTITKEENNNVLIRCYGESTVEHSGDEDGIRSQVGDLINQQFEEDGFKYIVTSAVVEINEEKARREDEDYRIMINGYITLKKQKI